MELHITSLSKPEIRTLTKFWIRSSNHFCDYSYRSLWREQVIKTKIDLAGNP